MKPLNVAALFAANCRPRQLQLSPRAFHLLARPSRPIRPSQRNGTLTLLRYATHSAPESEAVDQAASHVTSSAQNEAVEEGDGDLTGEHSTTSLEENPTEYKPAFKKWMRTVPKSVAIITARRQDTEDRAAGTVAATVSSFNTVAFEPEIYVSFNLRHNSSTLKVILETRAFAVTFPENNKYGMELAHRFARGDLPRPTNEEKSVSYSTPSSVKSYFTRRGLQQPPCVVSATLNHAHPKSGYAFGSWYEYHSSVRVGDHVVVIAKATPYLKGRNLPTWTTAADPEGPFFTSRLTLGHVHGHYASEPQVNFETFKLDDKSRSLSTLAEKKAFIASRLNIIAQYRSKMLQGKGKDDFIAFESFKHFLPEVRDRYQRYYMARLARLEIHDTSASGHFADIMAEMAPWEQLLIRQKTLIDPRLLEEEKQICLKRLAVLESKSYDFQETSETDANDEELIEAMHDLPDDSPTTRREGLRQYWTTRLRHVIMAQMDKLMEVSVRVQEHSSNMWTWLQNSTSAFVTERKDWPVATLSASKEQYDRLVNDLQRSLIRIWSGKVTVEDPNFVANIINQYKHMTKCSLTLAWMIARRRVLDGDTDKGILKPRIPQDSKIIAQSVTGTTFTDLALYENVKQATEQFSERQDMEMSHDEFQSLLTGVMDSIVAKRKAESKKNTNDKKTTEA